MITLTFVYILAGLTFALFAGLGFMDRSNPKRFGNAAFWGLLAGFGTRVAALVLAVFTVAASVIFHAYWAVPAEAQMVQQLMFFKNIAVVGGLLVLAAHGAGGWSLDAKRQR